MSTHEARRVPGSTRIAGSAALAGAALSVALHAWLARGVFVPVRLAASVEYVLVSASWRTLVWIAVVAGTFLVALHLFLRRVAARQADRTPLLSWRDVSYLRPLWCFALTAISLLNLVRPRIVALSVLSYVVVDLRWWWTALVLIIFARAIDTRMHGQWSRWLTHIRAASNLRWLPEVTIAIIAVAWSVFGTPILRDDGTAFGDEPKYIRYCENLYQGRGFDISGIKPIADLPSDFGSHLSRNVVLLFKVMPGELRGLATDAVAYLRNPSREFNRAHHREGGFLDGKAGGVYEVHNPGLSLMMLPAYYLDRTFTAAVPRSRAQWPARLRAVNALFLAIYAAWTVLMFRILRRCGASAFIAWVASLAFSLTLPAAAFPFQYYPELPAGLLISAVAAHIVFGRADRPGRSLIFGLAAGYLLWLHVRFVGEVVVFAGTAALFWRGERRRLVMFLAGIAIPTALFSLFVYRITGSAMPGALWMAEGSDANFNLIGMVKNTGGYLFDREWGLFAHSPVLLLALPGYWWLARDQPKVAWMSALVFLALLLPSAGKTLVQTTPMRLITAAIPFGAIPMTAVLERARRAVWSVFGLLLIVSLDTALAYNLYHFRYADRLVDWSFSGWKINLLFPRESRRPWLVSPANGVLLLLWIGLAFALLVGPAVLQWARTRRQRAEPATRFAALNSRSMAAHAFAVAVVFVALGTAGAALTGDWAGARFLPPPGEAALQAARMVDELGECTLCIASPLGRVSAGRIATALDSVDPVVARRPRPAAPPSYDEWVAMPGQIRAWYIEATGREPSPGDIGHHLYQWREEHVAPEEIRRRIFAAAGKAP